MKARYAVAARLLAAITLSVLLVGCERSYNYHYRITVDVRDHGKRLSASNVVRVLEATQNRGADVARLCGEATALRLNSGRYLFALLEGPLQNPDPDHFQWRGSPTMVFLQKLNLPYRWTQKDDSGIKELKRSKAIIQLEPSEMPEFVTFDDIRNPNSIKRVDPINAARTLGSEIVIEKVSLQLTSESSSRGEVDSILPWLDRSQERIGGLHRRTEGGKYRTSKFTRCTWLKSY